jgi:hypothetical protein
MLDNDNSIINPPYTGRPKIVDINNIEVMLNSDDMTPSQKVKKVKEYIKSIHLL